MRRALLSLVFVGTLLLGSQDVMAHGGGYGGFYGGLPWFGYGFSGSLYGLGRIPVPPYYAIHPPVYYSHPVARPYGASPYAAIPERVSYNRPAAPRLVVNPHVPSEPKELPAEEAGQTARVIHNPFFEARQQLASDD